MEHRYGQEQVPSTWTPRKPLICRGARTAAVFPRGCEYAKHFLDSGPIVTHTHTQQPKKDPGENAGVVLRGTNRFLRNEN